MNVENWRKWADDLINGGHQQNHGTLANSEKTAFCCLARACELAGVEYNPGNFVLSVEAVRWLGITSGDPILAVPKELRSKSRTSSGGRRERASVLNDGCHLTLPEIGLCVLETVRVHREKKHR